LDDALRLRRVSIIWITALDPAGRNPKQRAFVIISDCTGLKVGETVTAVAVTSTFREPVGAALVPMRWNARGTTETKFKRKCFAKADWLLQVEIIAAADGSAVFDGEYDGAYVRDKELRLIAEVITRIRGS
jgi:hypothetical protein